MALDENGNVVRNQGFTQVCVWPGTLVGADNVNDFTRFMLDELGAKVQYLEEVYTTPDQDQQGNDVPGTGGRCDLFFAVAADSIPKFSLMRLSYGMRWIEDIYGNQQGHLYPDRCAEYKTWDTGA